MWLQWCWCRVCRPLGDAFVDLLQHAACCRWQAHLVHTPRSTCTFMLRISSAGVAASLEARRGRCSVTASRRCPTSTGRRTCFRCCIPAVTVAVAATGPEKGRFDALQRGQLVLWHGNLGVPSGFRACSREGIKRQTSSDAARTCLRRRCHQHHSSLWVNSSHLRCPQLTQTAAERIHPIPALPRGDGDTSAQGAQVPV